MVLNVSPMTTLSFNPKVADLKEIDQAVDLAVDSKEPLPLRSSWCLWEQLQQNLPQATASPEPSSQIATTSYGDLTRKVASVSDIQSFWK